MRFIFLKPQNLVNETGCASANFARWTWVFIFISSVCLPIALHAVAPDNHAKRPVTVDDVVGMTKLSDRIVAMTGQVAQFSPDRTKFVVVLRKGNLKKGTNDYSLLVWRSQGILRSPHSKVLLTMSSSSNRAAISNLTWLDDNNTILFLGEHPGETHQIYSFSTRTLVLRRLTQHPTNIIWYSATPTGDKVAYVAEQPIDRNFDNRLRDSGWVISPSEQAWSLFRKGNGGELGDPQLFFLRTGNKSKRIQVPGRVPGCCLQMLSLSPDGRHIAMAVDAEGHESWKEYTDWLVRNAVKQKTASAGSGLHTYMLVDTVTGESSTLLDVPVNSTAWQVAWFPDNKSVAIGGTYLPLEGQTGDERITRRSKTFAVEIRIDTGELITITDEDLKLLAWSPRASGLIFQSNARGQIPAKQILFRKVKNTWVKVADRASDNPAVDVVLRQDMNTPPKLYAIDSISHESTQLLDLNPQFDSLSFGKVEEVHWRGTDGRDARGGLYYPVNYVSGDRYPLVIQTHGWDPKVFAIDGPYSTAFAAQPLAGKGIVVLQTEANYRDMDTPKEVEDNTAMLEGAIDDLDKKGLIDRERVGIIAWSRTCLHLQYMLTHSKYHVAAASITDGFDAGYLQYLLCLPSGCGSRTQTIEDINGGAPFGGGLKSWLERSPGANIDKVDTPLLIQALNRINALGEWQWFAILSRLGKPVEMSVLGDGTHLLERPWQRQISLQSNVDWLVFWLKGQEDTNPQKAVQYKRWRKLRSLQQHSGATPQPLQRRRGGPFLVSG